MKAGFKYHFRLRKVAFLQQHKKLLIIVLKTCKNMLFMRGLSYSVRNWRLDKLKIKRGDGVLAVKLKHVSSCLFGIK